MPRVYKNTACLSDGVSLQQEQFQSRTEVHVIIPDELKQCLVDDWDLITKQKQVSAVGFDKCL